MMMVMMMKMVMMMMMKMVMMVMMKMVLSTVYALLHCFLLADLIQSAPSISPHDSSVALRAAAERVKMLVEKILRDVPAAHAATVTMEVNKARDWLLQRLDSAVLQVLITSCWSPQGLTLDSAHSTNLQMMVTSLGIPAGPVLKPPSERFTLVSLQFLGASLGSLGR